MFRIDVSKTEACLEMLEEIRKSVEALGEEVSQTTFAGASSSIQLVNKKIQQISAVIRKEAYSVDVLEKKLSEIQGLYKKVEQELTSGGESKAADRPNSAQNLAERWAGIISDWKKVFLGFGGSGFCFAGDPVNMATGNFVYQVGTLKMSGIYPFAFRCFYNSEKTEEGSLGVGWTGSQDICLEIKEESILFHGAEGETLAFLKTQEGYSLQTGAGAELSASGEGYTLRRNGTSYHFSAGGRILRESDRNGNGADYIYEEDRLCQVRGDDGEVFTFQNDAAGKLTEVSGSLGSAAKFSFADGLLMSADFDGEKTEFSYDENRRMSSVYKNSEKVLENQYDEIGRVEEQTLTDDVRIGFSYRGNVTAYRRPNGTYVLYEHDEAFRVISVTTTTGTERFTYNDANRMTSRTDRLGNIYRFTYDSRGNLTSVLNPLGLKTSYTYDQNSRILSVRQADGGQIRYRYQNDALVEYVGAMGQKIIYENDDRGLPLRVTYPDGAVEVMEYDAAGCRISWERTGAGKVEYFYNGKRQPERIKTSEGITEFGYDEQGRVISVTRPDGEKQSFLYDGNGRMISRTDFDGSRRTWKYDAAGHLLSETDSLGHETKYAYDVSGNVVSRLLPNGLSITMLYDQESRLSEVLAAGSTRARYAYDALDRLICRENSLGEKTGYEYDACGNLVKITAPDGGETKFFYDSMGRQIRVEKPGGGILRSTYDYSGRLLWQQDELGRESYYCYDEINQVISCTDKNGIGWKKKYAPGGLLIWQANAEGEETVYSYDSFGRLSGKTFNGEYTLEYTRDVLGRVVGIRDSMGAEKTFAYDAAGRILSYQDASGSLTQYRYDPAGRLCETEDALGSRKIYQYDLMGNLEKVSFAPWETGQPESFAEYTRDIYGNVLAQRDALGKEKTFQYDTEGRLTRRTDREGAEILYQRDSMGRCTAIKAGELSLSFSYDIDGNLNGFEDPNGRVLVKRDAAGQVTGIVDYDGRELSYIRDEEGDVVLVKAFDGFETVYDRDALGRVTGIHFDGCDITRSYDQRGRLSEKRSGDGNSARYLYDPSGKLAELVVTKDKELLRRVNFTYDICGEKTAARTESGGRVRERTYSYDALHRIQEVFEQREPLRGYAYDGRGNRAELRTAEGRTTYRYDRASRLVGETVEKYLGQDIRENTFVYDAEGRLREQNRDGETRQYFYDALGHLTAETSAAGETRFSYGALGHLLSVENGEDTVRYRQDYTRKSAYLLGREDAKGSTAYVWDEFLTGIAGPDGSGMTVTDDLGSPLLLPGRDGGQTEVFYDEFGGQERFGEEDCEIGFAGLRRLAGEELYHGMERSYDPALGRFLSEDPVFGRTQGVQQENPYVYCFNRPLTLIDSDAAFPSLANLGSRLSDMGDALWNRAGSMVREAGRSISNTYRSAETAVRWYADQTCNTAETIYNRAADGIRYAYQQTKSAVVYVGTEVNRTVNRVERAVENIQDAHYRRNEHNVVPPLNEVYTINENGEIEGKNGWRKMSDTANQYHRYTDGSQGEDAVYNVKFVHRNEDGSSCEVIVCFPEDGREPYVVTDPRNAGTYNYSDPSGLKGIVKHFIYDVIPYYMWGNTRKTETSVPATDNNGFDWLQIVKNPLLTEMLCKAA